MKQKFFIQLLNTLTNSNANEHTTVCCNKQGTIALANHPIQHQRSKDNDIKYNFIRTDVQNCTVKWDYILSGQNVADLFKKPISRVKFKIYFNTLNEVQP